LLYYIVISKGGGIIQAKIRYFRVFPNDESDFYGKDLLEREGDGVGDADDVIVHTRHGVRQNCVETDAGKLRRSIKN